MPVRRKCGRCGQERWLKGLAYDDGYGGTVAWALCEACSKKLSPPEQLEYYRKDAPRLRLRAWDNFVKALMTQE